MKRVTEKEIITAMVQAALKLRGFEFDGRGDMVLSAQSKNCPETTFMVKWKFREKVVQRYCRYKPTGPTGRDTPWSKHGWAYYHELTVDTATNKIQGLH